MARKDFIISWFAGSPLLKSMLADLELPFVLFEPQVSGRKYKEFVTEHGNSVLNLWSMAKGSGDELGRVAVLGFSEGCQGVRATLETTDASAIDVVIPCDGIHTQKLAGTALEMSRLGPFIAFGRLAAGSKPSELPNTKILAITHSGIGAASLPPGMASTTETGEVIWNAVMQDVPAGYETAGCGWPCPAALRVGELTSVKWPNEAMPIGAKVGAGRITEIGWTTTRPSAPETGFLPPADFSWYGLSDGWTIRRTANNLSVFGWTYNTKNRTKDPTGNRDHVFQANMVLPYVARSILVTRWNPSCGPMMGYGADTPATACTIGPGYHDQTPGPLANPFPLGVPVPKLPPTCPAPPPGRVIIGREGDPCWLGPEPPPPVQPGRDSDTLLKAGALLAAGAVGFYGVSRYLKRRTRA